MNYDVISDNDVKLTQTKIEKQHNMFDVDEKNEKAKVFKLSFKMEKRKSDVKILNNLQICVGSCHVNLCYTIRIHFHVFQSF